MSASGDDQPHEAISAGGTFAPPSAGQFWLTAVPMLMLALSAACMCAFVPYLWGARWTQVVVVICAWVSFVSFIVTQLIMRLRLRRCGVRGVPGARLVGPWLLCVLVNVIVLLVPFTDLLFRATFHASRTELRAAVESDELIMRAGWFGYAVRQEMDAGVLLTLRWTDDWNMSLLHRVSGSFTQKEISPHIRKVDGRVDRAGAHPIRFARRLADHWYLVYWRPGVSPVATNGSNGHPPP